MPVEASSFTTAPAVAIPTAGRLRSRFCTRSDPPEFDVFSRESDEPSPEVSAAGDLLFCRAIKHSQRPSPSPADSRAAAGCRPAPAPPRRLLARTSAVSLRGFKDFRVALRVLASLSLLSTAARPHRARYGGRVHRVCRAAKMDGGRPLRSSRRVLELHHPPALRAEGQQMSVLQAGSLFRICDLPTARWAQCWPPSVQQGVHFLPSALHRVAPTLASTQPRENEIPRPRRSRTPCSSRMRRASSRPEPITPSSSPGRSGRTSGT